MVYLDFNQSLLTGFKEIDQQHKRIFNYINSLLDLNKANLKKSKDTNNLVKKLDDLLNYIHFHFLFEEKLMEELGIEKFTDHINEHRRFKNQVQEIMKIYGNSEYSMIFEICKFIKNFYVEHIIFYDKFLVKSIYEKVA